MYKWRVNGNWENVWNMKVMYKCINDGEIYENGKMYE